MKPVPNFTLYITTALDAIFLPSSHPPSIYYHPTPTAPLAAYQPLTPGLWRWLLARFATATAAVLAATYYEREALREYVELAYPASAISSAVPAILTPPYAPADLVRLMAFESGFLRTENMIAWVPRI